LIYAPIAIFVYKRPSHTLRMITSLMECSEFEESPIYVFCDGAKTPREREIVEQTREVIRSNAGKNVKIIESDQNLGLANSIIAGVSLLLNSYDRVIVVEDDLTVSPGFLQYMNMGLETYQNESSVMHISGYMYMVPAFASRTDAMFLPFISSWGWATWQRAWMYFDPEATGWEILQTDKNARSRFDLDNCYGYSSMMKRQMTGLSDSWAIRWYWSIFKNNGYALFPSLSHVKNIGFDGSGSHGWFTGWLLFRSRTEWTTARMTLPKIVAVNPEDMQLIKKTVRISHSKGMSVLRNIRSTLDSVGKWKR
jgi:GT2 family glycosyltransferase